MQCHVCGSLFRGLGNHVRPHGLTALAYRQVFGLYRGRALSGRGLQRGQSRRQRARYRSSAQTRQDLAPGQDMARGGQLWWRAKAASGSRPPSLQLRTERERMLASGRLRQHELAEERLGQRLRQLGFPGLAEYFQERYVQGQASLEGMRDELGVGRARLIGALDTNGIERRPAGRNRVDGKRSRARRADVVAAQRVGVDDIRDYIADRSAAGWTVRQIALAVDHSDGWVRARRH